MTCYLLAAGGSGGHVLPAITLAQTLIQRGHTVVFATDSRGDRFIPETARDMPGLTVTVIRAGTLRKNPLHMIRDMWFLAVGVLQSFDLIRDHRPAVVVGFGGYPSFPPVLAAQILRIPTILHSADAVVGRANLILARFCTRLALSFPNFKGIDDRLRARTVVTGLPLRPEIEALVDAPYIAPDPDGPFHVTILGGSQGAGILGLKLAQMIVTLPAPMRARLRLTHQVRADDLQAVQDLYAAHAVTATCAPFFKDIPDILATTHLFIGRSGASTVMEMAVAGRPAIYIPLLAASHHDAQQRENANVMVQKGAASIIEEADFTADNFLAKFTALMHDPALLTRQSQAARGLILSGGSDRLADAVMKLSH